MSGGLAVGQRVWTPLGWGRVDLIVPPFIKLHAGRRVLFFRLDEDSGKILTEHEYAVRQTLREAPKQPARPITADERNLIQRLGSCRFLPGSWDKRFVRDMQGAEALTPRQAEALQKLAHRYRRQLARQTVQTHDGHSDDLTATFLELARAGRRQDFLDLAGMRGLVGERLWHGTRLRIGLEP